MTRGGRYSEDWISSPWWCRETRAGFYPSLLYGFEAAAGKVHHQALICNTEDNLGRQADIILQLLDKKVGGVVINPTSPEPTPAYQVRLLQEHGIPVVFCHHRVEGVSAPLLAIPYRDVGRLAGKTLAERGHRRVAFFTGQPTPESQAYEEGLREVLQACGDDVSVQSVYIDESEDQA